MRAPHILLVAVATASCQNMDEVPPPSVSTASAPAGASDAAGPGSPAGVPTEPFVIREAALDVEVADCLDAVDALRQMAEARDGYAPSVEDRSDETSGVHSATVVIRVPAAQFQPALDDIAALAIEVRSQSVSSTDVTEEYLDLDARLTVKRSLEQRFIQLFDRAESTTEALEVERALGTVREEIERMEGRRQYLRNRVEMSTLTVTVREPIPAFARLTQAAVVGRQVSVGLLACAVAVGVATAPFVLPLGLVLAVMTRRRRRVAG